MYTMIRVLAKQNDGLSLIHINAQSLKNKMEEFRYTFEKSNTDIICVSETWFQPELHDSLFALNGYKLYRADRGRRGGGVAVYIRCEITCKIILKSTVGDPMEFIFLEVAHHKQILMVGVAYHPNKRINPQLFIDKLDQLALSYNDIIICGDFNDNVLQENLMAPEMQTFGLELVNKSIPTHFSATSNSLIDLVFVSCKHKISLYDQLSASLFSRHDLCFLSYDFQLSPCVANTFNYRDFKNINHQNLYSDIASVDWDKIYVTINVDEQTQLLQDEVKVLYEKHAPLKSKTLIYDQNPWFDLDVKSLIDQRDRAYARWKKFKIVQFQQVYKYLRNKVNSAIRKKKMLYFGHKFEQAVNSKDTWKHIRSIGVGKEKYYATCNLDPNQLNDNFVNTPLLSADSDYYANMSGNNLVISNFSFNYITQADVDKSIINVKSNSVGSDGIDPKFFKIIYPYILPHITHLFNSIILKSQFPSAWKHAKIVPIPKSRNEYRPIAILSYLSKVFERIINNQIIDYLESHSLLSHLQSGFRKNHSCVTALQKVSEDLRFNIDDRQISILILLDHTKAFDSVDHNILCMKLEKFFAFSQQAINFIRSYLTLRSQSVVSGELWSEPLGVLRGVPQGSILGPLLYTMYSNDLPLCVEHSNIHMYADDVQLYRKSRKSDFMDNVLKINSDLNRINDWAKSNGLCLNPSKSKCIIISDRNFVIPDNTNILISNISINIVSSAKNLGVTFNDRLNWQDHIVSAVGKTNAVLRNLYVNQQYTPERIRILLAKSFLVPKLIYGCELFSSCCSKMMRKLNVAFNNIIRYVFQLSRRDHVSEFAIKLYGVTFESLIKIRTLTSLHRIINTKNPPYLFSYIRFAYSPRGCQIIQLRHNKKISDRFFFINAIRLWNQLPSNLQTIVNDRQFKSKLFEYFG